MGHMLADLDALRAAGHLLGDKLMQGMQDRNDLLDLQDRFKRCEFEGPPPQKEGILTGILIGTLH